MLGLLFFSKHLPTHLLQERLLKREQYKHGFCSGWSNERNNGRQHEEESRVYVGNSKNSG